MTPDILSSPYYLDTSVQIGRYGGMKRRELKAILREGNHSTSTQVHREWNLYTLESCAAILNALPFCNDRQDLIAHLNRGYGRTPSRHWTVCEWIAATNSDLRVIELRARTFLRVGARAAFRAGVTTIRDGTECGVARRGATRDSRSKLAYDFRRKKTDSICVQPSFFTGQRGRAIAAAKALQKSSRSEDATMGEDAERLLSRPPGADYKGKACWGARGLGGDICIALECAKTETLLTIDESFDLICPAIGINHKRL